MRNYILKRIFTAVILIFIITVINFILINLAPGNPVDAMIDPNASQEVIQLKKEALGLNGPLYVRYFKWLINVLHGNLGYSMTTYQPVSQMISYRIMPTLILNFLSLLIGFAIAIPLGIASAVRQYSKFDSAVTSAFLIGMSTPSFVFALLFIFLFSVTFRILPSSGMYTIGSSNILDRIRHLILPVVVLSIGTASSDTRFVRTCMLDVLGENYLRTARSKGLKEFTVIHRHAFRNALNPIVTITGTQVASLLGGSVVVEQIFSWPGLGQLTYQSITGRDYTTLMAINLITSVLVAIAYLLTDIVYTFIDPRIHYE